MVKFAISETDICIEFNFHFLSIIEARIERAILVLLQHLTGIFLISGLPKKFPHTRKPLN